MRRWLAITMLTITACGDSEIADQPVIRVRVDPPVDASCIGVSAFEMEVTVEGQNPRTAFLARTGPVLSRDDCAIDRGVPFGGIDLDSPVQISVRGYDGAGQLRVQGTTSILALRDESSLDLALEAAGVASLPVVAIDRQRDLLAGEPLGNVDSIELTVPGQSSLEVVVNDETRPFFEVGDPWAVAYPASLVDGDDLTARVTLVQGGAIVKKLVVSLSGNGDYFDAAQ